MPAKRKTRNANPDYDSEDLWIKVAELTKQVEDLTTDNSVLKEQLQSVSATNRSVRVVNSEKDLVPIFEAKVPSTQPLKRNAEVEHWLRRLELLDPEADDAFRIRQAKVYSKGQAEVIINSEVFACITDWSEFKKLIRKKFRGTCTSSEFFKFLQEKKLSENLSPKDLYLDIETCVLQGKSDYPSAFGDSNELIRRTFLQALPFWLKELVAPYEDAELEFLVDSTTRIWNYRLERRVANDHAFSTASTSESATTAGAYAQNVPYCAYHRFKGHSTVSCRKKPDGRNCWTCGSENHKRKECPFRDER